MSNVGKKYDPRKVGPQNFSEMFHKKDREKVYNPKVSTLLVDFNIL